jgi:hypothetical protein
MQIEWLPLIFLFVEKMLKSDKFRNAIYLGIVFALQLVSSSYNTIHLSFFLPFYLIVRVLFSTRISKVFLRNIFLSLVLALLITSPYLIKRATVPAIVRTVEENMMDYWKLDSINELLNINYHLYMGTIQFLLTFLGIIIIWHYKEFRKYLPFLITAAFALICMIGPFSVLAPYYWLFKLWPYFNHLRVPFRIYPFFLLGYSVVASIFLLLLKKYKHRSLLTAIIILTVIIGQILVSPWLSNYHIFT